MLSLVLAMSGQVAPPAPQAPPVSAVAATPRAAQPARKLYNETADVKAQIAAAVKTAAEDGIRVLVNFGANDCARCLTYTSIQRDKAFTVKMPDEYKVVYVDVESGNMNLDVARAYGVAPVADALPLLAVIDATGALVARATGLELAADTDPAALDANKTGAFLIKNQAPPPPNALPVFEKALASAKQQNKALFLWFAAPW